MAVISAFNEADGLAAISDITQLGISTLSGVAITGVARGGFTLQLHTTTADHDLPSPMSEGWIHLVMRGRDATSTAAVTIFEARDNSGNSLFGCAHEASSIPVKPSILGSTISAETLASSGVNTYDIHFNIADSGGFVRFYVNTALIYSYSGDTRPGASTGVSVLRFRGGGAITGAAQTTHFGQVIVSDAPTINARVHTLPISAFATFSEWSGVVGNINAHALDDATNITADAVNERVTFTKGTMGSLLSGNVITAVGVTARALQISGSPVTQLEPMARISSTNYFGTAVPISTGVRGRSIFFAQNPATSAPWEVADVNAAEIGLRAVA